MSYPSLKKQKGIKRITILLNSAYGAILLLFLMDNLPFFDIKSQPLKTTIYYGAVIGAIILLLWNVVVKMNALLKTIGVLIPSVFILFLGGYFFEIMFSTGAWKTQTVLFTDQKSGKKIEFQMQDTGTFGYNKRIVEVRYLSSLFILTTAADTSRLSPNWTRVEEEVNEPGINHP